MESKLLPFGSEGAAVAAIAAVLSQNYGADLFMKLGMKFDSILAFPAMNSIVAMGALYAFGYRDMQGVVITGAEVFALGYLYEQYLLKSMAAKL